VRNNLQRQGFDETFTLLSLLSYAVPRKERCGRTRTDNPRVINHVVPSAFATKNFLSMDLCPPSRAGFYQRPAFFRNLFVPDSVMRRQNRKDVFYALYQLSYFPPLKKTGKAGFEPTTSCLTGNVVFSAFAAEKNKYLLFHATGNKCDTGYSL
jgi:hypothetical protein